ncbi:MAG: repeat protein [Bacteroidetes bacterium]|nr:repeat protein [Bacteroidota bacterium]
MRWGILLLANFLALWLYAQVPFNTSPTWISTDPGYATGAAWADINKDGWLDLVVANGNDMARQRVVVYYNTGTGTLPQTPNWQSSDIDYHGHLSVGDVNKDGYPDVAVSVYIGAAGFSQKGRIKLYRNQAGTLETAPSWVSRDSFYTFSCAFGDADGDGDLDLAAAGGEAYNSRAERNRIYYNRNGRLDSLPGWMSSQALYSYDVGWGDFDNDGRLDLVFANERGPNRMYKNYGDSIGTIPFWSSTDASQQANSLVIGDVNDDGYLDLAISDNNQLGGTGKFKIYLNNAGTLGTTPWWTSTWSGYGSGITFADIDRDGDKDLITGGWWQPCRIYTNQAGSFSPAPQWTSTTSSVVEAIVFGDYDNDGLDTLNVHFTSDGTKKLYYLPRAPLQGILSVRWNGDPDSVSPWCCDLENGWISFYSSPSSGVAIDVRAIASRSLDFAVSNWDNTLGNYLFRNTLPPVFVAEEEETPSGFQLLQNYPNPFNPVTNFQFSIVNRQLTILKVYDLLGREVANLVNEVKQPGVYKAQWDASGVASGVYLSRLQAGSFVAVKKLILLK